MRRYFIVWLKKERITKPKLVWALNKKDIRERYGSAICAIDRGWENTPLYGVNGKRVG